jgi:hypothetical protein
MALHYFSSRPQSLAPKELLRLRDLVGGAIGELRLGNLKVEVLKLRDNLYATTAKVPRQVEMSVNMDQSDIHEVPTTGDMLLLKERLEEFDAS